MKKPSAEFVRASRVIGDFVNSFDIGYKSFERLRTIEPRFSKLNVRRLSEWAPPSEMELPARAPQPRTQNKLIALAEWIDKDPRGLLERLGAAEKWKERNFAHVDGAAHPRSDLGVSNQPHDLIRSAFEYAGIGRHDLAASILLHEIARWSKRDPHQAWRLVPHAIYTLYRYCAPKTRADGFRRLQRCLSTNDVRAVEDRLLRDLSLAQLACAFNERRNEKMAAELLLHQTSVRRLFEYPVEMPWPRQQLVRNVSNYFAFNARNVRESLAYANAAQPLDPDPRNQRAVGLCRVIAHLHTNAPNFKKAWEAIEPHYWSSRAALIEIASTSVARDVDLLHLYADVFTGAITRSLSQKGYASRSELQDDIAALNWCSAECVMLERDDGLRSEDLQKLPVGLAELHAKTRMRPIGAEESVALNDLRLLLIGSK